MHWNDAKYVSNLILTFICRAHGLWKGCLKPIVSLKWGEVSAGWKQARNKGLDSSLPGTHHFLCMANNNEWSGEICSALSCFRGRKIHYVSSYPHCTWQISHWPWEVFMRILLYPNNWMCTDFGGLNIFFPTLVVISLISSKTSMSCVTYYTIYFRSKSPLVKPNIKISMALTLQ